MTPEEERCWRLLDPEVVNTYWRRHPLRGMAHSVDAQYVKSDGVVILQVRFCSLRVSSFRNDVSVVNRREPIGVCKIGRSR